MRIRALRTLPDTDSNERLGRVERWFPKSSIAGQAKEIRQGFRSDRTVRESADDPAGRVPPAGRSGARRADLSADFVAAGPPSSPAGVGPGCPVGWKYSD